MNPRLVVIALCLAGLAVVGGLRLRTVDWGTALPEWVPEFRPRPLPQIGERRLATHWMYALALRPDYRLYAWGGDGGQSFPGPQHAVESPVVLDTGLTDWRYISADVGSSYAITKDGSLLRRPMHRHGATAEELPAYAPLFPGMRWTKVQQRMRFTMGLSRDGALKLWSEDALEAEFVCPAVVQARAKVECVTLGPDGTYLPHREEDLAAVEQVYLQSVDTDESRAAVVADTQRRREVYSRLAGQPLAWTLPEKGPWLDFCLAADGEARRYGAWALDAAGKLWRIAFDPHDFRTNIEPAAKVTALATPVPFQRLWCSGSLRGPVMLMDADRRLWGFGRNDEGALSPELKAEQKRQRIFPYEIKEQDLQKLSRRRWLTVAPGDGYSLGIAADGSLWAWGDQYFTSVLRQPEPAGTWLQVDRTRKWSEVDLAGGYLLARDEKGEVYSWGSQTHPSNPYVKGLLGDGGVADYRDTPRPIVVAPSR